MHKDFVTSNFIFSHRHLWKLLKYQIFVNNIKHASVDVCMFIFQLVSYARSAAGEKNLANKTLVDERFLI